MVPTREANRQWLLARRPEGALRAEDFRWNETEIPQPGEGEVLVRNVYLSCDPTQHGWMSRDTYLPAIPVGGVIRAFAAAEVVRSLHPQFIAGQRVQGLLGWQDYAVIKPNDGSLVLPLADDFPMTTGLGILGLTGLTAYFGLLEVGRAKAGETLVVSGAAGATGAVVGQIGKILGCRVIGSAGGEAKCRYLTQELGFDAAIDYKRDNIYRSLRVLCPQGIDVFFDNVGGAMLDAALAHIALHGRIVLCGAISTYNDVAPASGPKNYLKLLVRRARMEGFVTSDYFHRASEATSALSRWLREGQLKERVDIVSGLENAPEALMRLFDGRNQGKQMVKIAEPSRP